jgi:glycosyltransferase involved in cell wall biosynthesis
VVAISLKVTGDPLVGIGVPVHNGERYLTEGLTALASQSYGNIEIVVSDNASTDGTGTIARRFAEADARVRYVRSDVNRGAVWNFNRAYELAPGDYFMWAAHDDIHHDHFVAACVAALEAEPDAALCTTGIRLIDERGAELNAPVYANQPRPFGMNMHERVMAIARARYWYDVYGLMRRDLLAKTRIARPIWGWDVVLLLELCLLGDVIRIPETLFSYRLFPEKEQREVATGLGSVAPSWGELTRELARTIARSPLPPAERARLLTTFMWNFCARNPTVRIGLAEEVISAITGSDRARRLRYKARRLRPSRPSPK